MAGTIYGLPSDGSVPDVLGYALRESFVPHRAPSIILFGDSRTADSTYQDSANFTSTNLSWFHYGQFFAEGGPRFRLLRNAAVGGNTTAQMEARFQSDVLDYEPDYMTILGGVNDAWGTVADVETTLARILRMIDAARAAGVYVFAISELPISTRTPDAIPLVHYFNDKLRDYCNMNAGVEYWDFAAAVTDPASATGYPLPAVYRDGIHFNAYGASKVGKEVVAPRLARFGHRLSALVSSAADTKEVSAVSRNIAKNPLMLGTGGVVGAGATGTLPDGWDSSGSPDAVFSVVPRADGFGNDIRAEVSKTSAGTRFLTQTIPGGRMIPGKSYVMEASLTVESGTSLYRTNFETQITSPSAVKFIVGHQTQNPQAGDSQVSGTRTIWQRFTIPAGVTATNAQIIFGIALGGAGSAVVRIGRVSVKQVD